MDPSSPLPEEGSDEEWLRLLQSAVESAADSVLITDAQLDRPGPRIVYVNRAFSRMTGYDRDDVLGQTPRLLQGPKTDRTVLNRLRSRLEQGLNFRGEAINYRKDGSEFVLEWDIEPIRDDQGRITHWVSTQRDKTQRRRIEQEVLEVNARKLRAAREALNDLVGLLGEVAHGSAVLTGAVQASAPKFTTDATRLQGQAKQALDDALALAKRLNPVSLQTSGLTMALLELAQAAEDEHDVDCTFERRHPVVVQDREHASRLFNIAQEAVDNAVTHGGAEHVTIRLSANAGAAMLAIQDDGVGVPDRVARERSGPGLKAMERYAQAVGGTLDITPNPDGGTTVTCIFPIDRRSPATRTQNGEEPSRPAR